MTSTTLNLALSKKEEGNKSFSSKEFSNAISLYTEALNHLKNATNDESKELMVILYSNRAACQLAIKEWDLAIKDGTSALEIDPDHEKSIYRRAQVY